MHINTAVMKHILPILEQYEGKHIREVPFADIARQIKNATDKEANFLQVNPSAVINAKADFAEEKTFSLNIVLSPSCTQELTDSSQARRNRFRHLVSVHSDDYASRCQRLGLKLEGIRTGVYFTINFIIEPETNRIYFAAIVSYYGISINNWSERVGLQQTLNKHSAPSTHFMDMKSAHDYVFILNKIVKFDVLN